jgi:hypothetical protein
MDYTYGERAITHRAGPVRVGGTTLLYYACYILITLALRSLSVLKNPYQSPLGSYKIQAYIGTDSGKRLCFILSYDNYDNNITIIIEMFSVTA